MNAIPHTVKPKVWQVLGKDITNCKTSTEAIEMAGLDFEVLKRPNIHPLPSGVNVISDNSYYTFRTDTEAILGDKVGRDYEVVQNTEVFTFFDALVKEHGSIQYENAGSLGYGELLYVTAKLPDHIRVGRDDLIEKYLLLSSSHDGSGSITIAFTPVRVYCRNSLNAVLKNCTNAIKIRHTASAADKLQTAHKMLGLTNQLAVELEEIYNCWTRIRISDPELKRLLQIAMAPNAETLTKLQLGQEAELSSHFNNMISGAMEYALTSPTQLVDSTRGTLFGAYNCVTGYLQNVRNFKDDEGKFKSILYGDGLKKTQSAFDLCLGFAKHGRDVLTLN